MSNTKEGRNANDYMGLSYRQQVAVVALCATTGVTVTTAMIARQGRVQAKH